jgi:hypothetical protein
LTGIVESVLDLSFLVQAGIDGKQLYFIKYRQRSSALPSKWGAVE